MSFEVTAYGTTAADLPLKQITIKRRKVHKNDVRFDILYCGVCHTDIHTARNEWGRTKYPSVPGHELVGRVTEIGCKVTKVKVGDIVAVGCLVDSCKSCESCNDHEEQYCLKGYVGTYNGEEKTIGGHTYGGYSKEYVVRDEFILTVPKSLHGKLAATAPLVCAGITTYSPLARHKVGPGMKVGVVGLGGLGHMGLKFAKAMGAHTVLLTTSANKVEDAKRLGADEVILSKDKAQLTSHAASFDFILDTVSAKHDFNELLALLKRGGKLCLVGAPDEPTPVASFSVIANRRSIVGSLIGGIKETQEMLNFCGEKGIVSDIELIAFKDINTAYDRVVKSDVKFRFVIDVANTL